MKHLKLFEDYQEEGLLRQWYNQLDWKIDKEMYQSVTTFLHNKTSVGIKGYITLRDKKNFDEAEVTKLKSIFQVMGLKVICPWDEWILITDKEDDSRPGQCKIVIFKLDDDYYLVYSFHKPFKFDFVSGNIIKFIGEQRQFSFQYVCDQFDGLVYLLKRLLVASFIKEPNSPIEESVSVDALQEAQDYLEDQFLSVLEDWGFEEASEEAMSMYDTISGKDKVYYFYKNYRSKRVLLTLLANTTDLVNAKIKQDRDLMSELRPIFKKVESVYPDSAMENNITIEPTSFEPFFRVVIVIQLN